MNELDLKALGVTAINQKLYKIPKDTNERHWVIKNPMGQHAIACGVDAPLARSTSWATSASTAAA